MTCSRTTSSASARPPHPAPLAKPASCRFKSAVLYVPHLNAVAAPALHNSNNVHHVDLEAQRRADEDRAFQAVKSMEKHHVQNGKKNQKHHREYEQYQYHNKGRSGSQKQRGSSQRHRQQHGQQGSASKSQPIEERTIRGYDRRMIDDVLGNGLTTTQSSPERGKSGKDHKGVSALALIQLVFIILTIAIPRKPRALSSHKYSMCCSLKAKPANLVPKSMIARNTLVSPVRICT